MTVPSRYIIPTTVVGSYPQPEWLIDRVELAKGMPPHTRRPDLWQLPSAFLQQAQDDATIVAIRQMESAGIDIITDGEIRRESFSNGFLNALSGVDEGNPATIALKSGSTISAPRIVGPIRRTRSVNLRDMAFLRAETDREVKITLPGPFTMSRQVADNYYKDDEGLAMALADAINAEAHELQAAGADVIQLDEPWVRAAPIEARRYAIKAINRALQGLTAQTVVHVCFGYAAVIPAHMRPSGYPFLSELSDSVADQISIEAAQPRLDLGVLSDLSSKMIILGVLDLADPTIEPVETIASRIRLGLRHVTAGRLIVAPDCGMKYMSRRIAFGKLAAMSTAASIVRNELTG